MPSATMDYTAFLAHFKSHGRPDVEAVIEPAGEVTYESFDRVTEAVACMNHVEEVDLKVDSVYVTPEAKAKVAATIKGQRPWIEVGDLIGALVDLATPEQISAALALIASRRHDCADCRSHLDRMDALVSARPSVQEAAHA